MVFVGVDWAEAHNDVLVMDEARVELDAHHDLLGLLGVIADQAVQLGKALHADPAAPAAEYAPGLIHHQHVVVGLGPVDAHEDHLP